MYAPLAHRHRSPLMCSSLPANLTSDRRLSTVSRDFPAFLPREVEKIKDYHAIALARRIERIPVPVSKSGSAIMSSCVRPLITGKTDPVVLLHSFDRYAYPLLEKAGLESWAIDILGWGFSDIENVAAFDVASKRKHLYQLWRTYIKRPIVLVGPSLGAAVAIDFAVNHPEAVSKLVFICGSCYAEGTGMMATFPKMVAYAGLRTLVTLHSVGSLRVRGILLTCLGVALLKSSLLRLYLNMMAYNLSFSASVDRTNVGRLHCLMPRWEDATVNFMESGGYNVTPLIKQVKQKCLVIWGENDQIISYKDALRMRCELEDATLRKLPDCGHIPHLEKPKVIANLIANFAHESCCRHHRLE